jgi:hypothetical protein
LFIRGRTKPSVKPTWLHSVGTKAGPYAHGGLCLGWVKSAGRGLRQTSPVYPRQRTSAAHYAHFALGATSRQCRDRAHGVNQHGCADRHRTYRSDLSGGSRGCTDFTINDSHPAFDLELLNPGTCSRDFKSAALAAHQKSDDVTEVRILAWSIHPPARRGRCWCARFPETRAQARIW